MPRRRDELGIFERSAIQTKSLASYFERCRVIVLECHMLPTLQGDKPRETVATT